MTQVPSSPAANPIANPDSSANRPLVLVAMGVSGCGKSTLARALADHYRFNFIEADDYHTDIAKQMMANGIPLTDEHREPWIQALCHSLRTAAEAGQSSVMAYSGLRSAHRQRFRQLGLPIQYLHLVGEKELIRGRMAARTNHYMPPGLLDSQFASLEPTDAEADIIPLPIDQPVPLILDRALQLSEDFIRQHRL